MGFEGSVSDPVITGTINVTLGDVEMGTLVDYYVRLVADIQAETEDDYTDLEDCLDVIVRRAETRLWTASYGASGFRTIDSGTLTPLSSVQDVYPSENKTVIHAFKVTVGGRVHHLMSKDESYVSSIAAATDPGTPESYVATNADGNTQYFLVGPQPAGAYPYEIEYSTFQSVVDNPTTSWLAKNAYRLLFLAVMIEVCLHLKYSKEILNHYREPYKLQLGTFMKQRVGIARSSTARDRRIING